MRIVILLTLVFALGLTGQEKGDKNGLPAPKNLQIIKGDDVAALRQIMAAFRAGLGVQCAYCHEPGDFASDDNPNKNIARGMMRMVDELATRFPDGKRHVTCYTCHRGTITPLMVPPSDEAKQ